MRRALAVAAALAALGAPPAAAQGGPGEQTVDTRADDLRLQLSTRLDHRVPIEIEARRAELSATEETVLSGDVEIRYGQRHLLADEVRYDPRSRRIRAAGNVRYSDPGLEISGTLASFDPDMEGGAFTSGSFKLKKQPGRGEAAQISRPAEGLTVLTGVTYTACPEGRDDWLLSAPMIALDRTSDVGVARKVKVEFKGVPIFYSPYLSFPLSDKRKSGFLVPDIGTTDRSGTDISVPYYLNLAPNMDATLNPRYLSQRGLQLRGEYRYLTRQSSGKLNLEYLPNDDRTNEDRRFSSLAHVTRFGRNLKLLADVSDVSDGRYFEDLGRSLNAASITHLQRRVDVNLHAGSWRLLGRFQDFQTLDASIAAEDRPYERLPQFKAEGDWGGATGLAYAFDGELVNLERDDGATGQRLDLYPELSLPLRRPGLRFTPKVALSHTRYELDATQPSEDPDASRTTPIVSLDGSAIFERSVAADSKLHTLEPRVVYNYIPFRSQDDIPVFDTGRPDLNFVQLFRPNRFVGADRMGDTEQLSLGVTSRLLDSETGSEFLNATVGQIFFFDDREVTLPGEEAERDDLSDLLAEVKLRLSERWNADVDYQWDPDRSATEKAAVRLQFRPLGGSVFNLGYRFRRDDLEQSDVSFALPIGQRWEVVGRWNFSLADTETLERFLGMEYESCCWAVRLVSRRYVSTRAGETENTIFAQFELKGLSSVGARTRNLLERGILGYSEVL